MKFPKDRDGFSGQGNKDARFIDDLTPAPFLTRRRPTIGGRRGSVAKKKNGFLEVRLLPLVQVIAPFLWSMLPRTVEPLIYRRHGTSAARKTVDYTPILRSPPFMPTGREIYVGGNYILSLSHSSSVDANNVCSCWVSLINARSGAPEVLSGSAGNVAGANVSFQDVVDIPADLGYFYNGSAYGSDTPSAKPSIFACGYDPLVDGYTFGVIGRRELGRDNSPGDFYPASDDTVFDLVCWVGNTKTRTLTRVDLPGSASGWQFSRFFSACTVGVGRLLAIVHPYTRTSSTTFRGLAYPDPPKFLRSDDHGRTWYLEDADELVPHLFRQQGSPDPVYVVSDVTIFGADVCAPTAFHACPMGGGRIGMVVLCGKAFDHTTTSGEIAAARPPGYATVDGGFLPYFTRWKFFLSDASGHNFVNVPWPADAWDGFGRSNVYAMADGDWSAPALGNYIPAGFMNPITTAGPGTFFISAGEQQAPVGSPDTIDLARRFRMLYTLDYGASWSVSGYIDTAAVSESPGRPQATPIVARPYVGPADLGEIYMLSVNRAGTVRLFKTDATFAAPALVYEQLVTSYYFTAAFMRLSGVYTGNPPEARYRSRVFPGYPEFDKP